MVDIIVVLTVVSMAFEIALVRKVSLVKRVLARFPLVAVIFSLALSLMLGVFFGAAGLLVFVAGLASTMLMTVYYRLDAWGVVDGGIATANKVQAGVARKRDDILAVVDAIKEIVMIVVNVITVVTKIISLVLVTLSKGAKKINSILAR